MAAGSFAQVFSPSRVRLMAGGRSFERGSAYAESGHVSGLVFDGRTATARVRGSTTYRVRLALDDGEAVFSCTCPVGADGDFCKHCVAVALTAAGKVPDAEPVDVRGYLADLPHGELVELVLGLAEADEILDARLRLGAARAQATTTVPLGAVKSALDAAIVPGDFVDYRGMYDYAAGVEAATGSLRSLLDDGHAAAVVELAEYALARLEDASGLVDDSDGYLTGLGEELGDVHLAACEQARPDPEELAARLFDWECAGGNLEVFYGAAGRYADVLGERGLAAYRQRVEAAWADLPALGPGGSRSYEGGRYRITHMMETLTELTGDIDAAVAVLARDQSSAYQFVRIAERYRTAARYRDALDWAERGLAAFGENTDPRLTELAAEEYHRAGRGDDGAVLLWRAFERQPGFPAYQRLCHHARLAGSWDTYRLRALDRLRADLAARRKPKGRAQRPISWAPVADASDLVRVFLWEGDAEQAWVEAGDGGCSSALWLELARAREADHPSDAIPIYQAEIERTVDRKKNDAYREAVRLLQHVGTLMEAAGRATEFPAYAAELRVRHKPKRNLMKLFEQHGW